MNLPSCVQWDAVAALYARLTRVPPSTTLFEDLDHAVDLALNDGRTAPTSELLARASSRDARRIRCRREAKRSIEYLPDDFSDTFAGPSPTPEDEVAAAEVEALVRAGLRRGPVGSVPFFDAMVAGDPERLALGKARSAQLRAHVRSVTVKRLRNLAA